MDHISSWRNIGKKLRVYAHLGEFGSFAACKQASCIGFRFPELHWELEPSHAAGVEKTGAR